MVATYHNRESQTGHFRLWQKLIKYKEIYLQKPWKGLTAQGILNSYKGINNSKDSQMQLTPHSVA